MIKKILFLLVLMLLLISTVSWAQVNVRGHMRDTNGDGVKDTYVQPYQRSSPNQSRTDNYSHPGNYNPNTGQITPYSNSPRELYPSNPNPYDRRGFGKSIYDY